MMHKDYPVIHCARITLEARTPISVKADDADPTLDTRLMRDAHGLPTLPGTSLAGVSRHLFNSLHGKELTEALFGRASSTKDADLHVSRARFSFGYVHDSRNRPVRGPVDDPSLTQHIEQDAVLAWLMDVAPILRDQVKINAYGSAEDKAKADRSALPRGTRFTFELQLLDQSADTSEFKKLLQLFKHPLFRVGGLTHRGFGAVEAVAINQACFDLRTAEGLKGWAQWRSLPWHEGMQPWQEDSSSAVNSFEIPLEAEDFWRIGQGSTPLSDYTDKAPDLMPYHERIITWQDNKAKTKERIVVVPASSIKGVLRHRTLYHYLRLEGGHDLAAWQDAQKAMEPLFGLELDHDTQQGGVGCLILDDIYLEQTPETGTQMHIAIDRFTGGVMRGALFSEELLWKGGFILKGWIAPPRKALPESLKNAFRLALEDLAEGRINLGADFSRGHGFFKAKKVEMEKLSVEQLFKSQEASA